jgi:hypothetical protein
VTRAFAPHLIANAPSAILNIVSVVSWLHPSTTGAYAAADRCCPRGISTERCCRDSPTRRIHGHRHGGRNGCSEADPATIAALALDGVERGAIEVIADDITRDAKASLSHDRGVAHFPLPANAPPFGMSWGSPEKVNTVSLLRG